MKLDIELTNDEDKELNQALQDMIKHEKDIRTAAAKAIDDKAELGSELYDFSPEYWIKNWNDLIDEIQNGYNFGMYDYTDSLTFRDFIQCYTDMLSSELRKKVLALVEPVDDKYRLLTDITDLTLEGSVSAYSMLSWWHRRVPKKLNSEFKADLDSLTSGH